MSIRRILALILAAFVATGVACGGSGSDTTDVLAGAGASTVEAGTAKLALEITMPSTAGPERAITGEGTFDFAAKTGRFTMDLAGLLGGLGFGGGDTTAEVVMDGQTLYLKMALLSGFLGAGDKWVRMDVDALAEQAGVDLAETTGFTSADPSQALAFFQGIDPESVEKVGSEEVRGAATTHYRADVDLRAAAKEAGAVTDQEAFDQMIESFGSDVITVDVWVDGDDRVRRLRYPVPAGGGDGGSVTMELYDFGAAVDIVVPPTADTVDLLELMGSGAGAGLSAP